MVGDLTTIRLTMGGEIFNARLRSELTPRSCERLVSLLPYRGSLVHARWSGQSCWAPLRSVWPKGDHLAPENAIAYPSRGEILLYGGELSEPELLIPYGTSRFACMAGPLAGNPVLLIEDKLTRLSELGNQILWRGAVEILIERP
jgi:hypothetical protein